MLYAVRSRKTDEMINIIEVRDKEIYETKHPDVYLMEPQDDLQLFLEDDDY